MDLATAMVSRNPHSGESETEARLKVQSCFVCL